MADTKLRIRKATQILKEDHEKMNELFEEYEDLGTRAHAGKLHLFMELKRVLTIHAAIEEEIFYPSILEHEEEEETEDLVTEAIEAHAVVKTLLQELSSLTPRDEEFDAGMKALKVNVLRHAREEEEELFPCFEELEADEQESITERMRQRRMDLAGEYE